ncbi:MAG: hypothetical protein ACK4PI_13045 [Tepidisphaerales bacterium]
MARGDGEHLALAWVFVVSLVVSVVSWPLHYYGSDPVAVREEARALLLTGRLDVGVPPSPWDRPGEYFVRNERTGAWVSKYGLMATLAAVPPLAAEYVMTGELPPLDSRDRLVLLNGWNTVLTVVAGLGLVRLAGLFTARTWLMVAFALVSLFGTYLWNYTRAQSVELVQVTAGVWLVERLVRWMRGECGWWGAWLLVGVLVLTRVYFVVLVPAVWGAMVLAERRRWWLWTGCALLVGAVLAWVNYVKFGSPLLTGYHAFQASRHVPFGEGWDAGRAAWGFLVSAQKGVWWHFPPLMLAAVGAGAMWRRYRREAWLLAAWLLLGCGPLLTVPSWAGEWGYGPRYLAFALPVLAVPAVVWLDGLAERRGARFGAGCVLAAVLAAGGVYLNWQVNRLEFFTGNTLRNPLRDLGPPSPEMGWHDDFAPYPGRAYFDRRPWGWIVRDIMASGGRLERHPLEPVVREVFGGPGSEGYEAFRVHLWVHYCNTNWYWRTWGRRFDDARFRLPPDW